MNGWPGGDEPSGFLCEYRNPDLGVNDVPVCDEYECVDDRAFDRRYHSVTGAYIQEK